MPILYNTKADLIHVYLIQAILTIQYKELWLHIVAICALHVHVHACTCTCMYMYMHVHVNIDVTNGVFM